MDTTKYDLEDVNPRRKNAIISQFGSFTCLRDQRSRSTSLSSAGSRSRKKSLPIDYLPTSNPFVIVKRKSSEPRKSIVDDTIKEEPIENETEARGKMHIYTLLCTFCTSLHSQFPIGSA